MSVIHAIGVEGFTDLSAALDALDPDFERLLIEGAYADIIARPNLSLKHRELVTVAVLTTMGNADAALRYHAAGMLNTGWTPQALLATVWQTLHIAGLPLATAGVRHASKVLQDRGVDVGHGTNPPPPGESTVACMLECTQPSVDALTPKERGLATLAIVMTVGNQPEAVRQHLEACLMLGWTPSELTEVLIQLTGYIGWPLVLPLSRIALDVFGATKADATSRQTKTLALEEALEHARCAPGTDVGIADISPELARHLGGPSAATSRSDSVDQVKARHLTAIACLTCLARHADTEPLVMHMRDALSLGTSWDEIIDAIIGAQPHAGVLAARSALLAATRLFASMNRHDTSQRENAAA
ncbi:carboxymuconolactone decarboxylase family protein [Burkholderia sp. AW49-1]